MPHAIKKYTIAKHMSICILLLFISKSKSTSISNVFNGTNCAFYSDSLGLNRVYTFPSSAPAIWLVGTVSDTSMIAPAFLYVFTSADSCVYCPQWIDTIKVTLGHIAPGIFSKKISFEINDTVNFKDSVLQISPGGQRINVLDSVGNGNSSLISSDTSVTQPKCSPSGNSIQFNNYVSVSITDSVSPFLNSWFLIPDAGSSVYYTTNGNDPDSNSTAYSQPIEIAKTTTLKSIAYKRSVTKNITLKSTILNETYNLKVSSPVASPPGSTFGSNPIGVSISTLTPGDTIRYTTDGTIPDSNSTIYFGGDIIINSTTTLKMVAFKSPIRPSDIVSETYTGGVVTVNLNAPQKFTLKVQNSSILFGIPFAEWVSVRLYNIKGGNIKDLFNGVQSAGFYSINLGSKYIGLKNYLLDFHAGNVHQIININ